MSNTPNDKPDDQALQSSEKVICYNLDELVAGVTPQNRHAEVSFGQPVGI